MNCAGCGTNIGMVYPSSDFSVEFCGKCNGAYFSYLEMENKIKEQEKKDRWDALVARYGFENACEIAADQGY